MKPKIVVLLLSTILLFAGCAATSPKGSAMEKSYSMVDLNEQLVLATLWMQSSAEYRALLYQTFNLAKMNLDKFKASYTGSKPLAIVVDCDETVIDNTAYEAFLVGNDFGYSSKTWTPWMDAGIATAMPGALEFLKYAQSRSVEIFYITNRKMVGYEGTKRNLETLGFPFVDDKHLLLRTDTSDKEPRRQAVASQYEIVLLMGDNLNDFMSVFGKSSEKERFAQTDNLKALFGTRFIVLPNPTYGEWEGAVYDYNWGASAVEKNTMRKARLKKWNYVPPEK